MPLFFSHHQLCHQCPRINGHELVICASFDVHDGLLLTTIGLKSLHKVAVSMIWGDFKITQHGFGEIE